jgi:hypothetical protein
VQGILEARHLYWRIKHNQSNNTVAFQTSYNNSAWVDVAPGGVAVTADLTTPGWHLEMSAGSMAGTTSVATVEFDDAFYGRPTQADAGADKTVRVGESVQLNGGDSFNASTYSWSCAGPNSPTVTGGTTPTPTISGVVAGEYTCTLSINGGASTEEMKLGAVAADATTYGVTGLPAWAELITGGSLVMSGAPTIPNKDWYEATRQRELYYWATSHPSKPPRKTFPGSTVNVTSGSTAVSCNTANCQFTSRIETDRLVNANMRDYITIDDGGTTRHVKVASIANDNSLVLETAWPHTTRTGAAWGTNFTHPSTGSEAHGVYLEASRYDFAVLLLEEYYRSGLTKWLTLFRKMADSRWASHTWQYGELPGGPDAPNSYYGEVKTLIARAADGRPEMWFALYDLVALNWMALRVTPYVGRDFRRARLVAAGSGYSTAPSCSVTTTGGGSGATCTALLGHDATATGDNAPYTDTDKVTRVTIDNPGAGFHSVTSPPTIVLTGGGGSGASFTVTVNDATGKLEGVRILGDSREFGYFLEDAALLGALLPDAWAIYANGTDEAQTGVDPDGATKKANLAAAARNAAVDFYIRNQDSTGAWRFDHGANFSDPALMTSQPYFDSIIAWGLIRTYGLSGTTAGEKSSILAAVKKHLDFVHQTYGAPPGAQILNCPSPARHWRTGMYQALGGPSHDPDRDDPPWGHVWDVTTTEGCNPPTEARTSRWPQTFWIWVAGWYYARTGDTTYRARADEYWDSLFGSMDVTDPLTGLTGDGAFSPGSYEVQSTKSKEGAESFIYTANYPPLRQ